MVVRTLLSANRPESLPVGLPCLSPGSRASTTEETKCQLPTAGTTAEVATPRETSTPAKSASDGERAVLSEVTVGTHWMLSHHPGVVRVLAHEATAEPRGYQ